MNIAEFILGIVRKLGTDTAFSLTGGMAMHINRAVADSGMQVIYGNHEQAVAAAADGYAKAKEFMVPGLAVVTSGPGVLNTVNAVASAYYDSVPLFVLAGQAKTADLNTFGVRSRAAQETPQIPTMALVTKCAFRYVPDMPDEELAGNMAQALAGRKGPVFCEIPLDIQPQQVDNAELRLDAIVKRIHEIVAADAASDDKAAAAIVAELARAERPVLVLGNGLRIAGVSRQRILELVERIGVPVLTTWASFDLLAFDHDLNFGSAGGLAPVHSNTIIQSADLLVFLGTRLDLLTTAFNANNYGKHAKRLVVECDENEIAKNATMSDTVFFRENVGNVVTVLETAGRKAVCEAWLAKCRGLRVEDRALEARAFDGTRFTTYQLARVLADCPSTPYVVPTASGFACEGFARFFKPRKGATFAWAGHVLGSMGLGLPCAIGAAAALRTPVVCVEGDGGILLNVQELFTLAANPHLALTVVVMNNGGYQSIIKSQVRAFGKEFGASKSSGLGVPPSFDLLAAAAGMIYERCETVEQFEKAMARTGTEQRLIEVLLKEDGYRGPSVTTKFTADGKPYSTDIGDVTWQRSA
jgi:acetolactate synthase-1/2/3 large subunit